METSQSIGKISEALSKAQGQMKPAVFDATNPHFKSRYATLAAIMEACRPALSANGIAVLQATSVETEPFRVCVTTILTHTTGEFIKETLSLKPAADTPQAIGSCISYARRYGLSALVGIVADDDDDGNAASTTTNSRPTEKPKLAVVKDTAPAVKQNTTPAAPPSQPVTQTPPAPVAKSESKQQAPQNTRVVSIRQIFQLSAQLGHTPDQMKAEIGQIIGLNRPITESKEIPSNMLDTIIEQFSSALTNRKEIAA